MGHSAKHALVFSLLVLAPGLVAQTPRIPRGIYAVVDTEGLINQQASSITTAQLDAYFNSLYQDLLSNPAVSGLTLQVHWDRLNHFRHRLWSNQSFGPGGPGVFRSGGDNQSRNSPYEQRYRYTVVCGIVRAWSLSAQSDSSFGSWNGRCAASGGGWWRADSGRRSDLVAVRFR